MAGYSDTQKAYRAWNPSTGQTITSRDTIFEEVTASSEGTSKETESYRFNFEHDDDSNQVETVFPF